MINYKIQAEIKNLHGTRESRKIRKINKIPAIIYGKNKQPISIKIKHNEILNYIINRKNNKNLQIIFKNNIENVCLKKIQKHHFKRKILHVDFIRI